MIVQEPFAGIVPPVKTTLEAPALAVSVPPQVLLALPETVTPLGNGSVSGAVRSATAASGLSKVMVKVDTAPARTMAGPKALLTVGGAAVAGAVTVSVATAGAAFPPLLVCSAPAGSELMNVPALGEVTFTVTVQEPSAGIDPPVNVTVELPATDASVPPHVVLPDFETTTPLGNVSVSGVPRLAALPSGLVKVIVRVETPPAVMLFELKVLLSVGGIIVVPLQEETATVFESSVTAPFCASALPERIAFVSRVMLVRARIFPTKVVPTPRVAELPTCQKT